MRIAAIVIQTAGLAALLSGAAAAQTRGTAPRIARAFGSVSARPAAAPTPALLSLKSPLGGAPALRPMTGGAQGPTPPKAPAVVEAAPSPIGPDGLVYFPAHVMADRNGFVPAAALLDRAGAELAAPGASEGPAAEAALGKLFGEVGGASAPAVPGGDLEETSPSKGGGEIRMENQLRSLFAAKGFEGVFTAFHSEGASRRTGVVTVRIPATPLGPRGVVTAAHEILRKARGLRRYSYLANLVWDIGIVGEPASYRTGIPAPAKRVPSSELKKALAALPARVATYHLLPDILAPFDGAYRVSTLAKDKVQAGYWSVHRRPGFRPGDLEGYYLVWKDEIR